MFLNADAIAPAYKQLNLPMSWPRAETEVEIGRERAIVYSKKCDGKYDTFELVYPDGTKTPYPLGGQYTRREFLRKTRFEPRDVEFMCR